MQNFDISTDLLKITGSCRATIKGEDCIIIRLAHSKARPHQNGSIYYDLRMVERQEKGKFGDTHFLSEKSTKEERDSGVKSAIIGNAKPIESKGESKRQSSSPPQQKYQGPQKDNSGKPDYVAEDEFGEDVPPF